MAVLFLIGCSTGAPSPEAAATSTPTRPASPQTVAPPTATPVPDQPRPTPAEAGDTNLSDSFYPAFGNGGYDVQHYTLDLTVQTVTTGELTGQATLDATTTQALRRFSLDFIGFTIDTLTVNGAPATFERAGQELLITPAQPLAAGEDFSVVIAYHGAPEEVASIATEGQVGWAVYAGGSYVLSEPDGAATYYPVNDHPLDKATYTFRVTVPKPFEVAANGRLAATLDQGETTTFVWEATDPMASYLTTVNIGQFDLETDQSPQGRPIRNYYATGLAAAVHQPFARQGEMLDFFSEIFGPYPFEVYGVIVLDTEVGTAMESQTLSIFGIDQVDLDDLEGTEAVAAHELAHQWFGNSLSVADWSAIWLNESFASYAEGLWIEHTAGREALDEWIIDNYEYVDEAGPDLVPPGEPEADDLFNEGIYVRGALTLHALRLEVGDERFFEIVRTYVERFAGGNVVTADFIGVAEEVSDQDLTAFFAGWLHDETMPPIPQLDLEPQ